ncbi:hypothetical protein [Bifidobacterium sp. SO1]|uniref:hypothetical protein n=1 Tax=Bifidobacterium sp. SO1 TaxID=2809029 RepID=UPI001BDCDEF8|nr:hypothetical protein [Bifidobacterium sp. SO1]MBT1160922.1 hypothetical protein [Bifidobacterium sp. SO1]
MTLRLNPALDEQELYEFAVDIEHWDMLDQIADHPNAWPELADWANRMSDDPGRPTPPPEPASEGRRRGLLHRSHPPLIEVDGSADLVDDPDPIRSEASPTEPAVADTADDDAWHEMPFDRDDPPFPENETGAGDDDGDDAPDAASAGRPVPWRPIAISACIGLLIVLLTAGGAGIWYLRTMRETEHRQAEAVQAASRCSASADAAEKARKTYRTMLAKAATMAGETKPDSLADATLLDKLSALADATTDVAVAACPSDSAETATTAERANRRAAKEYRRLANALSDAMDDIDESKTERIVADARELLTASKGKVADDKTRTALDKAIAARDTAEIAKASKTVNDSIAAKTKADREAEEKRKAEEEKQRAEQERREQEEAAQSQASTPSWTPSYTPSYSTPSTPSVPQQTTPQQTTPKQQTQSKPNTSQQSKPSTPQQSTPKTDPGNDGSML